MRRPAAPSGCSSRTSAGIADGDQRRDFIYVDDVVAVVRWLMETPAHFRPVQCRHRQGAQLPRDDRGDVRRAWAGAPKIEYVDMPESIRGQYQYFTQSQVGRLRAAGYNAGFTSLEDAVGRYVTDFLDRQDRYR